MIDTPEKCQALALSSKRLGHRVLVAITVATNPSPIGPSLDMVWGKGARFLLALMLGDCLIFTDWLQVTPPFGVGRRP